MNALDYLESLNRLLTVEEFAEFSRLSEKTIYRHIRSHRLPAIRAAGRIVLEPRATAAWLRERMS
jgi:excisionase family DNA binding protein